VTVAVVDGELVEDPDVSADRLLGLTCFETIAVEGDELVRAEAHLERLAGSARALGLGPEGGWAAVDEAIATALAASPVERGIVRVSLHATGEPVGLALEDPRAEVQVVVTQPRYGDLREGVRAVTSTVQAPAERAWPANVKAPCLPRYLAHREARGRDAFEGLMLDASDHVVCGSRSNVFADLRGEVVTPPSPPAFPGVTRERVFEQLGDAARTRPLGLEELADADEVWLSFTGPGVVPVVELDGSSVGDGTPGPRARELAAALGAGGDGSET
jgi:branched-subunit amino acid aminotransferase/4-amino-4-deoxychorismate lyase